MRSLTTTTTALVLSTSLAYAYPAAAGCWSKHKFAASDILQRDVLVVGGGATGTFAAVKLRDAGKTVAVVERDPQLGGHVDTYYDPASGYPVDYGVQAYFHNQQTKDFFGKFGVPLTPVTGSPFPQKIADFSNGYIVPNASAPDLASMQPLLAKYAAVLAQNFPYLAQGAYDLPDPVPADLLLPFAAFAAKYDLLDAVPLIWTFAQGVGNMMEATTLYVLQSFGLSHVLGLQAGFVVAQQGNQVVYDKAAAFLGADSVLYNSKVIKLARGDDGVTAVVKTATGTKLVQAKKLLVTVPPTLGNVGKFDLDATEKTLFGQWANVPYFIGVLAKTGLTDQTSFLNTNLTSPDTLPTVGVPGYQIAQVIGEGSSNVAQRLVTDAVTRLDRSLQTDGAATEFVRWEEHDNLGLHVSPAELSQGFYKQLYACQGKRSTWYTGNAWATDYSSLLWAFTVERILPSLLT
ncbi:FAD dependent oxidoreductase [Apiospora phragmitis]|uniref:FAD dependent oxidoreductase n=1 Tax=Apiospora phragmitis TaxID=2905665 RepID=A0ABR1WSE0_9PEZI